MTPDASSLGELNALLGRSLNVHSIPQLRHFLYETCGLPPIHVKEGSRNTEALAVDEDALLTLARKTGGDPRVLAVLKLLWLEKRRKAMGHSLNRQ